MASDGETNNVANAVQSPGEDEELPQEIIEATQPSSNNDNVSFAFIDHFSLKEPSSTVRFRRNGVTTRIYNVGNNQLQLEQHSEIVTGEGDDDDDGDEEQNNNGDKEKPKVKVITKLKRVGGNNPGLIFLRLCYTLVALLMAGFTFVFISNVIVMQTMEVRKFSLVTMCFVSYHLDAHILCSISYTLVRYHVTLVPWQALQSMSPC